MPSTAHFVREKADNIPRGWTQTTVGELAAAIQYGHTASAVDKLTGPRFLRITDIQDGKVDWESVPSCAIAAEEISKYKLADGDLVFARTGATTGKSFLIRNCPEAVFASYLIRVRLNGGVSPAYVAHFFQSPAYWRQIEAGKRGIGQPNVNAQILSGIQFPLPPLPEQRRIVAEIEKQFTRLEAGIAALRRVKSNLHRYRIAVLKAACESQLIPTKIPVKEWRDVRLIDICESITDGDHQPPPKHPQGVPYLTIGNISSGALDFSDSMFVSEEFYRQIKPDRIPRPNDILYTVVGASIGVPVLVSTEKLFCFSRHIALLKPSPKVLPRFLRLLMACPQTFREAWSRTTGSAQPTLALKPLRALPVKLPPLAEQERIVAEVERRLSVVEELSALVTANLQRATRLRQSILQRAFEGKLITKREIV